MAGARVEPAPAASFGGLWRLERQGLWGPESGPAHLEQRGEVLFVTVPWLLTGGLRAALLMRGDTWEGRFIAGGKMPMPQDAALARIRVSRRDETLHAELEGFAAPERWRLQRAAAEEFALL